MNPFIKPGSLVLTLVFGLALSATASAQNSCPASLVKKDGKGLAPSARPEFHSESLWTLERPFLELQTEMKSLKKRSGSASGPEKEAMLATLARKEEEARELKRRIDAQKESDRPRLLKQAKKILTETKHQLYGREYLQALRISSLPKEKTATLAVAGRDTQVTDSARAELLGIATALKEKGYVVLYDAHSSLARDFATVLGPQGLAVSAHPLESFPGPISVIRNPYLRLMALASPGPSRVVASPDSLPGMGLILNSNAGAVFDSHGKFRNFANEWVDHIKSNLQRDLGATQPRLPIATTVRGLMRLKTPANEPLFPVVQEPLPAAPETVVENLSFDQADAMLTYAVDMPRAMEKDGGIGGSVIYGSAKYDTLSVDLTYQAAYALGRMGVAVATGGSGGAMHVANTGAYDAGGLSLGIPIAGRHSLSTEKTAFTQVHTTTILTSGYEVRIPVLMQGRAVIAHVPGGNGTLKEFAVGLVDEGAAGAPRVFAFLDSAYYGKLVEGVLRQPLPEDFKQKVRLFNTADSFVAVVEQLKDSSPEWRKKLVSLNPPARRTDRTSFGSPEKP